MKLILCAVTEVKEVRVQNEFKIFLVLDVSFRTLLNPGFFFLFPSGSIGDL